MYKWPQGRVIRTVCLILTLMISADLAWNGAWGPFSVYFGLGGNAAPAGGHQQLALGLFFSLLSLGVIIAGLTAIGFAHPAVDFLIEVEQEMVRVEWPKLDVLIRSTLIIAVAIALLSCLILVVDLGAHHLLQFIQSLGGMLSNG
jgi:preprotein translocase SecE subunit